MEMPVWNALHVVPVSISYEWDPCDALKVNELCTSKHTAATPRQKVKTNAACGQGLWAKRAKSTSSLDMSFLGKLLQKKSSLNAPWRCSFDEEFTEA